MELFIRALDKEAPKLHENGVKVEFIGEIERFSPEMQKRIVNFISRTPPGCKMTLNVAANYGGRWDITNASRRLAQDVVDGHITIDDISETELSKRLSTANGSDPDLLIRTGGEMRISNFLLWQAAYAELYFTPVLWPDFGPGDLDLAIAAYTARERRFGALAGPDHKKAG